jgi:uncharacterized OB-fold protein
MDYESMSVADSKDADAPFWAALAAGHLQLQRCAACKIWHWPAVFHCAACGSFDQEWVLVPLEGTVFTWTRTHHPFPGTEGLERPFVTALVTITGTPVRLLGILEGEQEGIGIEAPVTGRVLSAQESASGMAAIRWRLAV